MVLQALPTAQQVAAYLDWPEDTVEQVTPHLTSVISFVRSYVRGKGFDDAQCEDDLAAVIVSATARSAVNPAKSVRVEIGSYSEVPAQFTGFTLVEQSVLHRYRRRAT
jgi:hypothetical protein